MVVTLLPCSQIYFNALTLYYNAWIHHIKLIGPSLNQVGSIQINNSNPGRLGLITNVNLLYNKFIFLDDSMVNTVVNIKLLTMYTVVPVELLNEIF